MGQVGQGIRPNHHASLRQAVTLVAGEGPGQKGADPMLRAAQGPGRMDEQTPWDRSKQEFESVCHLA